MGYTPVRYTPVSTCLWDARLELRPNFPKVYLKLELIVHDKPLGRRGVGWHTVVCYGGPEWFRRRPPHLLKTCQEAWRVPSIRISSHHVNHTINRLFNNIIINDTFTAKCFGSQEARNYD